jgi:hypothetical protein
MRPDGATNNRFEDVEKAGREEKDSGGIFA